MHNIKRSNPLAHDIYIADFDNQFQLAAEQFRLDVRFNPNDAEEALWAFASEARLHGVSAARSSFLRVGKDPRPFVEVCLQAFRELESLALIRPKIQAFMQANSNSRETQFYCNVYLALYAEASCPSQDISTCQDSKSFLRAALNSE